jgi:hypothetical protein
MVQTPPPSRTAFRNHRATAHQQRSTTTHTHTHTHTQQSTAPSSSTPLSFMPLSPLLNSSHSTAPANHRPLKIPRVIQRENKKGSLTSIASGWTTCLLCQSVCLSASLSSTLVLHAWTFLAFNPAIFDSARCLQNSISFRIFKDTSLCKERTRMLFHYHQRDRSWKYERGFKNELAHLYACTRPYHATAPFPL